MLDGGVHHWGGNEGDAAVGEVDDDMETADNPIAEISQHRRLVDGVDAKRLKRGADVV